MKVQKYVLGFCFDTEDQQVILIRKERPDRIKGLWNGLGGSVNRGEFYEEAMSREFKEECGFWIPPLLWRQFCIMTGPAIEVHMFETRASALLESVTTTTDEKVSVWHLDQINSHTFSSVNSLKWIIPLAQDRTKLITYVII